MNWAEESVSYPHVVNCTQRFSGPTVAHAITSQAAMRVNEHKIILCYDYCYYSGLIDIAEKAPNQWYFSSTNLFTFSFI